MDDNQYVDYVGTWGPAICGHANDEVNDALKAALEKGTRVAASFGPTRFFNPRRFGRTSSAGVERRTL